MKRVILFIIIILMSVFVFSAPSIGTTSGGLHTITAILTPQRITFSNHISIITKDFSVPYTRLDSTTGIANDTYAYSDINYGLAYTFTKWLEISVKNVYKIDAIKHDKDATGRDDNYYISHGIGDVEVGVKLTTGGLFGATDAVDFGVYGFYRIATGQTPSLTTDNASFLSIDYIRNEGGIYRYFTSNSNDYGAIGILSLKTQSQLPIEFNFNGGYLYRTLISGDKNANEYIYGASLLAHFGAFIPFVEVFGNRYISTSILGSDYIIYGAGGVRFDTPSGIVIDLGADYRFNAIIPEPAPDTVRINNTFADGYYTTSGWGALPEWRGHIGISYYYDLIKEPELPIKKEEKKTIITGKIVDATTGEPLTAEISLPGYTEEVSIVSDSTGTYRIEVIPGTIRVKVKRSGYKWKEKGVIIEKGQTKILDFALNKKEVEKGIITGKVVDKSTGDPVIAKISFPKTDIPEITVDPTTGIYRIELDPGTYTMAAVADGYINWAQPVVIENSKTLVMNIEMLKKGGKIELRGIYFDSGKATIKPESYPILDGAVKMLKENPKVKIEIQGHTDSVGSASSNLYLSQSRAEAVRNYLIAHGIEAWRIIAKGYGETMPIADNTTKAGRARNRRIEFLIIGE